jgi:tRNA G37 N-methylase TrmD/very-short-patch-repair endonuclease
LNPAVLHTILLTLFPELFPGPLGASLTGKALERGIWSLETINIREFGLGRHQTVDDTPYGGGAGMVMRPDVIDAAIQEAFKKAPDGQLIYLTPRGRRFDQRVAARLVADCLAPHPDPLPREREFDSVPRLTQVARKLRQDYTIAENKLWKQLRNRQLNNLKFRRQHPIENYVVDFLCEDLRLIVELDGGQHNEEQNQLADQTRTEKLESLGYKILRFWNNQIFENLTGTLEVIASTAGTMNPPLPGERDGVRGKPEPQVSQSTTLIFICGRYEAIDERVIQKYQPLELSLGDFVMTGGELAAIPMIDACVRLLPGVVGEPESLAQESFGLAKDYALLLEHPHYTKPPVWEGSGVPETLLSGDHAKIARWRLDESREMTKKHRPDLWEKYKGLKP